MATSVAVSATSSSSSSPATPVATASGLLAMLNEPDPTLQSRALERLLLVVDTLWHEVSESLPDLEAIAEDDSLDAHTRQIAASVASRVFFHLEEPVQALRLALEGTPSNFDVVNDKTSEYVDTLVSAAVEAYIRKKKRMEEEGVAGEEVGIPTEEEEVAAGIDVDKLQRVVHLLFQRCYADRQYGHALGIAFEACEASKVQEILSKCCSDASCSPSSSSSSSSFDPMTKQRTLRYALDSAVSLITTKTFRTETLQIISQFIQAEFNSSTPGTSAFKSSAVNLMQCYQLLHQSQPVSDILSTLLDGDNEQDALLGLQLCFDLVDSGDQNFVTAVARGLPQTQNDGNKQQQDDEEEEEDDDDHQTRNTVQVLEASAINATPRGEMEVTDMESSPKPVNSTTATDGGNVEVVNGSSTRATPSRGTASSVTTKRKKKKTKRSDQAWKLIQNAHRILSGGFTSELSLSFLHKNSDSDPLIMAHLKKTLEDRSSGSGRNSVLHNCAVVTHSYLNAGTTNDSFLRDHLDWMKKASNWAKFSATASLGVLHAGHTTEAMTLLEPYLPPTPESENGAEGGGGGAAVSTTGGYAEGGSLYALGLIHGSHAGSSVDKRKETADFLRKHLRASHANEVISHGAALGVGLTAFGTADLEVVNELKELLYTDSAVAGEAAGMAIGMVLVGTGAGNTDVSLEGASADDAEELLEIVSELKNYARETQHEKIIRGIAMGMALINYGQEENADAVIEEMRGDRDPILRYGAQYAIALAYCGTGSNRAIRILLHTAVSDVSDDVRMAAVIGLAFVLYKTPERVPQLVKLLLESFNPHVRYASCMAVGIAMAGSGDHESVALLEPMLDDMTDFVRQGALIGTAMIYMQQSDACNSRKVKSFREKLLAIIGEKHQSTLTKMGAILSTGIIDAGGRNCSLDLGSRNGFTKMTSAVGLALWLQHWYWYPMMHMLSLALTPTFTIGLNKDFKYPKNFEIQCNAKPSMFAYPKRLEEKKEEKKKRVETVTLSTTAKSKARLARKRAKEAEAGGAMAMDIDKKEETKADEGEKVKEESKVGAETSKGEGGEGMEIDGTEAPVSATGDKKPKKKREPEPTSFRISNPSRITKAQSEFCAFDLNQRYRPVLLEEKPCGVIMLTDSTPGEEEDLGAVKAPSVDAEDEADPPEPFEWAPPGHPEANRPAGGTSTADATEESGGDDKPEAASE